MIERMNLLLPLFFWVINSVLLAKYYSVYLKPKSERIPGKYIFVVFAGLYFLSQYCVDRLLSGLQGPLVAFGGVIILIILVFVLSRVLFENNLRLNIFLLLSFFAAQEICMFILLSIGQSLGKVHINLINYLVVNNYFTTEAGFIAAINAYSIFQFITSVIIYAAIVAIALRSIIKKFTYYNYSLSSTELSYLVLPCLPGLLITHIIRALLIRRNDPYGVFETYNEVPFIDVLVPVSGFILLLSMIAAVLFYQKLAELHDEETERAVLQKQVEQFQKQVNDVDDIYLEIKGLKHDIKNHISNVLILANEIVDGNTDVKKELEEYLGKIGTTLDKLELTYKTGNSVSDIIIHQKHHESIKKGIDFSADFIYPKHMNIDSYDLAIILSNALDNAIEACAKMDNSDSFIRLHTYTKGKMFFIEIENSCDNVFTLNKNTGLPISNKPDTATHGTGLSNIRRCAEKYFGDMDFQISEAKDFYVFRLTVMLQGKEYE